MDGDGIPNDKDNDIDGDDRQNGNDSCCGWGGGCNGSRGMEDTDGDGIPDEIDPDQDGDGIPNTWDEDQDGDGVLNFEDIDVDADEAWNDADLDDDNDGILDADDTSPQWYGTWVSFVPQGTEVPQGSKKSSIASWLTPPVVLAQGAWEECSW
jgi:hypothetical protein